MLGNRKAVEETFDDVARQLAIPPPRLLSKHSPVVTNDALSPQGVLTLWNKQRCWNLPSKQRHQLKIGPSPDRSRQNRPLRLTCTCVLSATMRITTRRAAADTAPRHIGFCQAVDTAVEKKELELHRAAMLRWPKLSWRPPGRN